MLVDDGRVLGDSTAIAHYLDVAYPDAPSLFPRGTEAAYRALEITCAVDLAMNTLVDLGTRYFALRTDPAWPEIVRTRMERAQGAIEAVARSKALDDGTWGAPQIWALSATLWVRHFPERVATAPLVAQIVTLGFRLPEALLVWAAKHESRPEVRAIYG